MKFIPLNKMFREIKTQNFTTFIDKLKFIYIFLIWGFMIVVFGLIYSFSASDSSYLFYNPTQERVTSLSDGIYFSFITATTTGFGDILPVGLFKVTAIIEVIFGLLLLALVTSKLVSIKQDVILGEIYEISFNERINRLRSSMFLFRQNVSRIINKIESTTIRRREINEMYMFISALEDILREILIFKRSGLFLKEIDTLRTELILNSVLSTLDKLYELVCILNENNHKWNRNVTLTVIDKCLTKSRKVFEKLNLVKHMTKKGKEDLDNQLKLVIKNIKIEVKKSQHVK